jgi:hypothetical protein
MRVRLGGLFAGRRCESGFFSHEHHMCVRVCVRVRVDVVRRQVNLPAYDIVLPRKEIFPGANWCGLGKWRRQIINCSGGTYVLQSGVRDLTSSPMLLDGRGCLRRCHVVVVGIRFRLVHRMIPTQDEDLETRWSVALVKEFFVDTVRCTVAHAPSRVGDKDVTRTLQPAAGGGAGGEGKRARAR